MMKVLLKPALLCVCVLSTFSLAAAPPGKRPYVNLKRMVKYEELNYRGTLLDDQNNPVANASIRFPRKQQLFQSNRLGMFDLSANNGDTIVVSATGFKTTNYVLGAEAQFVLTLDADNNNLPLAKSSVVQYPYNQIPAKESLASTGAVYNNDLIKSPVTSFRNAVTGRLAGLYTLQSSGLPGADNANLFLRGQSPIFIIDGIVTGITTFDLEEIESVTVFKDAVATAMLGIRGSRGAVVITTKKGSAKKQQLSFTVQSAVQQPLQWFKPLDAFNYATLRNEALRNDGVPANSGLYYSQTALDAYRNNSDPINYPNVDYRRAITNNTANFNRYTFSATGGNKSARYFVAAEHVNQGGFFKTDNELNTYNTNNNFRSYIIRSNVDLNITNKLTAGLYLLGRIQNTNEPGAASLSILNNLLNTPANSYPLRNADNTFAGTQLYQNNILAQTINSGYRQYYNRDVLVNLYLKQSLDDFVKGLWIKGRVAYSSSLTEVIDRSKSFAVFQQGASSITQYGINGTQSNFNFIPVQGRMDYEEFSVGYDNSFDKHNLSMLVLANRDNATNAIDPQALPYTVLGTSGRLAYNYDGKYLAEATFGWNGVNRFAPEGKTKLNFFPAVGLGWNINKESFFKSVTAFNNLKLYTSLGLNGWDNSGYFIYYPRYQDGPSPYFGTGAGTVVAITEGTLANSNITYEKSRKFNVGLTGSLLNNRLSFTAEYYNNRYYDLVQQRGYNSTLLGNVYPNENIGRNRYSGLEGQLSWQQRVKDFQYFIALNATTVASKVLYMDEVAQPNSYMYRTGQPVDQFYGYVADGLFQSQAEINSSPTTIGYRAQPGDIKYKDLNGDGVINQNDQTTIGSTKPLFFYGVSLGAGWKGFDISALFQGVQNRNVYLSGNSYWAFQNFGLGQAYEHNLNRWTPQNGASATYPRLSYGPNPNNDAPSSFWVRSGDYFRLKNAEIGYTIPSTVVGKIGVSSVRVFANGYNLFTKSSSQLDGLSPESFAGGFPVLRLYNFGINVKF